MKKTELSVSGEPESKERQAKPKSAGNKNFRKHNKLGFYRFMQKKKRIPKQRKRQ